ncbi:MAG: PAS domain-containing protein, partial [Myxococcales bacterium]
MNVRSTAEQAADVASAPPLSDEEKGQLRTALASVPDSFGLLEGLFAHSPVPYAIFTADGHVLLTNPAYRRMFGAAPPPEYDIFKDEITQSLGLTPLIRRAFAGETIHAPTFWYDPRALEHVAVASATPAAIAPSMFPVRSADGTVTHMA